MKIKICGLNPARDVQLCINLKVNYLGFVFYEKSPRNISLPEIKKLANYDKKGSSFVPVLLVAAVKQDVYNGISLKNKGVSPEDSIMIVSLKEVTLDGNWGE